MAGNVKHNITKIYELKKTNGRGRKEFFYTSYKYSAGG